jgi:hypothetical protein
MNKFEKQEPKTYKVKGYELRCPICENKYFRTREALLNTKMASFFNFDWANRAATCYVCSKCTHILWFYGE